MLSPGGHCLRCLPIRREFTVLPFRRTVKHRFPRDTTGTYALRPLIILKKAQRTLDLLGTRRLRLHGHQLVDITGVITRYSLTPEREWNEGERGQTS